MRSCITASLKKRRSAREREELPDMNCECVYTERQINFPLSIIRCARSHKETCRLAAATGAILTVDFIDREYNMESDETRWRACDPPPRLKGNEFLHHCFDIIVSGSINNRTYKQEKMPPSFRFVKFII